MATFKKFEEIQAWQKAREVPKKIVLFFLVLPVFLPQNRKNRNDSDNLTLTEH